MNNLFVFKIKEAVEGLKSKPLSDAERAVMSVLYNHFKENMSVFPIKVTQQEIAQSERWLGCHPKHEERRTEETTLRKVRQIIRDLRLKYNAPILSDKQGYWIPNSQIQVLSYLERIEAEAQAQTKAWFYTYKTMKNAFGVESKFFEANKDLFDEK